MKAFVSFKFTGMEEEELNEELSIIRSCFKELEIDNFISFFDSNENHDKNRILKEAIQQIDESDIGMIFINHSEKSEGMLLEIGMMQAMNKDFVVFVRDELKDNYFLSYAFAKDIINFKDFKDLEENIMEYFALKLGRQKIDIIDKNILHLLKERKDTVKKIGKYKKNAGIPPLQPQRWKEVLEEKKKLASEYGLETDLIEDIWKKIHEFALELQKNDKDEV